MIRLLRAGFLRYVKNIVFWLSVAVTSCLAVFFGINYGGGYSAMAEFVVFAVLLTWIIGREQGDGMFHNKILAGYTRTEIYFSELLLGCGACAFLFFIFALIYAFVGYRLEDVSSAALLELLLGALLANLVMAAFLVALACLIGNRYAAVVICILLTIGMPFVSVWIRKPATIKEYRTETKLVWEEYTKEDGTSALKSEVRELRVYNTAWVGEPAYTVCVFLYNVLPAGQMQEYEQAGGIWQRKDGGSTELYLLETLEISEEDEEEFLLNLVYALIALPVVCAGGWLGFRKREFL
ncbi:MAG: hypothetical protein LUE29_03960 [Lachnospiraceae bacterium]|nr:hypothetical protein [Lachnospiraceae bacterium]